MQGKQERPSVTRDRVFAAADALAGEGIQPTVKLIGDRGGRSLSTIAPNALTGRQSAAATPSRTGSRRRGNVATAFRQVWAAACNAAQAAIHAEREGLASAKRTMKREGAELAEEITGRPGKLDAAQKERG